MKVRSPSGIPGVQCDAAGCRKRYWDRACTRGVSLADAAMYYGGFQLVTTDGRQKHYCKEHRRKPLASRTET